MTKRSAPPHLRVISQRERDNAHTAKSERPRERQLAFPYPETSAVFLVHVPAIGQEDFSNILGILGPRWIIDVRAVPRLDVIANNRVSAFMLFERAKAAYVDLFGRLGIRSYRSAESNPAFWRIALVELLKTSERKGPYLFLFDNELLMRSADDILPAAIQSILGKSAHFVNIDHSDAMHAVMGR